MAEDKPEDRGVKPNREAGGEPGKDRQADPNHPNARDEGAVKRNGRHRGFRGRHGGRIGVPEAPRGDPREAGEAESRDGHRPRQRPEEARDMPQCPICGKAVYDLSTALAASREAGDPAHFDCVLERVVASENLTNGEKLVYLGSGAFGVVEFKDRTESAFVVRRRIQWEKEGEKKDWRKGISSRIANL